MARKPAVSTPRTTKMETEPKPDFDPALVADPETPPVPLPTAQPAGSPGAGAVGEPTAEQSGSLEVTHAIVAGNENG